MTLMLTNVTMVVSQPIKYSNYRFCTKVKTIKQLLLPFQIVVSLALSQVKLFLL